MKKSNLKPIAAALGAIFAVSLAVSPVANAADNPFIKSGKAKSDEGDYDGAIADYDRALEHKPDYASAYYNRGVAYDSSGDKEEARRGFLKVRELVESSGNAQSLNLIDEALSELDNENNNSS